MRTLPVLLTSFVLRSPPVDDEERICSLYAAFDQIITSVQIRHMLLVWSMGALCMLRFGIAWNPPIETKRDPQNSYKVEFRSSRADSVE
jgi:hypothetical protein